MKKTVRRMALIILSVLMLFSAVGCGSLGNASKDESFQPAIEYQIGFNKDKYAYGEEITIEFLFNTVEGGLSKKDGHTYCVKIQESTHYEIIGKSEVYTDGCEDKETIKGVYANYCYRAVFKIKVTDVYCGTHSPKILVKCVNDNWLDIMIPEDDLNRADPEFPFATSEHGFSFTAVEDGVEVTPLYSTTPAPKPWWYRLISDLIYFILGLFGIRISY